MHRTILLPVDTLQRIRHAARHPDLSAITARTPLVGRRMPGRAYWRTQRVEPARAARHAQEEVARLARVAGAMLAHATSERAGEATRSLRRPPAVVARAREKVRVPELRVPRVGRPRLTAGRLWRRTSSRDDRSAAMPSVRRARSARRGVLMLVIGAAAGALAMFYADPHSGRRRRALVRDKLAHMKRVMTRNVPRAAERRGRFLRGKLEGLRHEVQELTAVGVQRAIPDDDTLVARVRSDVFRHANVSPGDIHFDAHDGCVTLRGELRSEEEMRRLIEATRQIDGVREVRSYLHLPGTLPPNKAEAFAAAGNGVPSHLLRQP